MDTAKMGSKGRITIPKAVRSRMSVQAGDRLAFEFDGDGAVRMRPLLSGQKPLRGFLAQYARGKPSGKADIRQALRAKYGRSLAEEQCVPVREAAEEQSSFTSAVVTGLEDLEAGRELSLAEVKARLLDKDKTDLAAD